MYIEPEKTIMLNTYNQKANICLAFFSQKQIPYDYRNGKQMRSLILDQFQGTGWRTRKLFEEVQQTTDFTLKALSNENAVLEKVGLQ